MRSPTMVVRETSSSRKKRTEITVTPFKKKNPVPFICLPRFYSSSSAFLNVSPPPSSLTTDHEKSKYVHEVKQSVNLWNTLAMRSASLYSLQLQKKKIEEEKKKNPTMLATTSEGIFNIHELFHFTLMNNSGWPAHHWVREKEGEGLKKKKKGENNWGGMQR